MDGEEANNELNKWFSTYGAITAQRLLGTYKIKLSDNELVEAVKSPFSLYHRMLKPPLRNVLNGIIIQQANDYHVYSQKLIIDYLLSGENSKGEEAQGAATREEVENERKSLVKIGDEFLSIQEKHDQLISRSQKTLIRIAQTFNKELDNATNLINSLLKSKDMLQSKSVIRKSINHALIFCDMSRVSQNTKYIFIEKMNEILKISLTEETKEQMVELLETILQIDYDFDHEISDFLEESMDLSQSVKSYRNQFYDSILRIYELLKSLPEYKIDPEQDAINRESLYFDRSIGLFEQSKG